MATNYLKAGGMFKFTDTAEDDLYIFPAKNCEMIEVGPGDNTSVILTFSQSGDNAVQNVDLTVTAGKADEVAAFMAHYCMHGGGDSGSAAMTNFTAGSPLTDVTGIATAKACLLYTSDAADE